MVLDGCIVLNDTHMKHEFRHVLEVIGLITLWGCGGRDINRAFVNRAFVNRNGGGENGGLVNRARHRHRRDLAVTARTCPGLVRTCQSV